MYTVWMILCAIIGWWLSRLIETHAREGEAVTRATALGPADTEAQATEIRQNAARHENSFEIAAFVLILFVLVVGLSRYLGLAMPQWTFAWLHLLAERHIWTGIFGFLIGYALRRNREPVRRLAWKASEALLGREASAVLQGGFLVLLFVGLLLLAKPNLLDHIDSIKAGEVEIRVAAAAPATRRAISSAQDFASNVLPTGSPSLNCFCWKGFGDFYAGKVSKANQLVLARAPVGSVDAYDGMRRLILDRTFEPLAVILDCYGASAPPSEMKARLANITAAWRNVSDSLWFEEEFTHPDHAAKMAAALDLTRHLSIELLAASERYGRKCVDGLRAQNVVSEEFDDLVPRRQRVDDYWLAFHYSIDSRLTSSNPYKIDLYTVTAIADLIELSFGPEDASVFLARISAAIAKLDPPVSPELMNLKYQLAIKQSKIPERWDKAEVATNFESAYQAVSDIVALIRTKSQNAVVTAMSREEIRQLMNYYEVVRFRYMTSMMTFFNKEVLDGQEIDGWQRQRWRAIFAELGTIMSVKSGDPIVFHEVSQYSLPSGERDEWRNEIDLGSIFALNGYNALAISAISIDGFAPSTEACIEARHYLSRARGAFVELRSGITEYKIAQLEGPVRVVDRNIENQIAAACGSAAP